MNHFPNRYRGRIGSEGEIQAFRDELTLAIEYQEYLIKAANEELLTLEEQQTRLEAHVKLVRRVKAVPETQQRSPLLEWPRYSPESIEGILRKDELSPADLDTAGDQVRGIEFRREKLSSEVRQHRMLLKRLRELDAYCCGRLASGQTCSKGAPDAEA